MADEELHDAHHDTLNPLNDVAGAILCEAATGTEAEAVLQIADSTKRSNSVAAGVGKTVQPLNREASIAAKAATRAETQTVATHQQMSTAQKQVDTKVQEVVQEQVVGVELAKATQREISQDVVSGNKNRSCSKCICYYIFCGWMCDCCGECRKQKEREAQHKQIMEDTAPRRKSRTRE